MKKILFVTLATFGMLACTGQNDPDNPKVKDGMLPGKFSVSDTTQVQFSQGNLQYQASTRTWRFAEHQYDTIGVLNMNKSDTYDGWIDLFPWRPDNGITEITYADWGVHKISNGGDKANVWRALKDYEWDYLFKKRANAEDLCGHATVAGVHGFIFLPDNWKTPSSLTWQGMPNNWTTNKYSVEDWSKMEKAGAVFLPAAGQLLDNGGDDKTMSKVGSLGGYWSSNILEGVVQRFYFEELYVAVNYKSGDWYDRSVRLVH